MSAYTSHTVHTHAALAVRNLRRVTPVTMTVLDEGTAQKLSQSVATAAANAGLHVLCSVEEIPNGASVRTWRVTCKRAAE